MTVGQGLEWGSRKPRNFGSHQKLPEARNGPSLEPLGGPRPYQRLNFVPVMVTSAAGERGHFCRFKSV